MCLLLFITLQTQKIAQFATLRQQTQLTFVLLSTMLVIVERDILFCAYRHRHRLYDVVWQKHRNFFVYHKVTALRSQRSMGEKWQTDRNVIYS